VKTELNEDYKTKSWLFITKCKLYNATILFIKFIQPWMFEHKHVQLACIDNNMGYVWDEKWLTDTVSCCMVCNKRKTENKTKISIKLPNFINENLWNIIHQCSTITNQQQWNNNGFCFQFMPLYRFCVLVHWLCFKSIDFHLNLLFLLISITNFQLLKEDTIRPQYGWNFCWRFAAHCATSGKMLLMGFLCPVCSLVSVEWLCACTFKTSFNC
jgi:hypothetical protein